jgi:hypothetical protein
VLWLPHDRCKDANAFGHAYFAAEPWRYELVKDRAEMDLAEAGLDEGNLDFWVSVMMRADFFELHMADGKRKPKGKAYGALTGKNILVLRALLFHSYDDRHPSYEAIREKAECSKSAVSRALRALKAVGLSWENLREAAREASTA